MEWVYVLEKDHKCSVDLVMGPEEHDKAVVGMVVSLQYARTLKEKFAGGVTRVTRYWPNSEYKSLPSMIIKMCHDLERQIEDREAQGWLSEV